MELAVQPVALPCSANADLAIQFHHVGVACVDIDKEMTQFSKLGYAREGDDFADFEQGIKGRFLSGQFPRVELLMQIEGSTVLSGWLDARVKMYHLAYETIALDTALGHLCDAGAKIVRRPTPAAAFQGRQIAFVMLPNMLLIELISM